MEKEEKRLCMARFVTSFVLAVVRRLPRKSSCGKVNDEFRGRFFEKRSIDAAPRSEREIENAHVEGTPGISRRRFFGSRE